MKTITVKNLLLCLAILFSLGGGMAQEEKAGKDAAPKVVKIPVGAFKVQYKEHSPLSNAKDLQKRADVDDEKNVVGTHDYRLKNEDFMVYVPEDYRPWKPFGIMVWIDPQDKPRLPNTYPAVFKEKNLIWVAASNCGFERDTYLRKMPLALDAVHNLKKMYNIDPNRIYISGITSGASAACRTAIMYPEVFKGGVFLFGVEYWDKMKVPSKKNSAWGAAFKKPKSRILRQIKKECRYVVINAEDWANSEYVKTISEKGLGRDLKDALIYREIAGMGLAMPFPQDFGKAIDDVDARFRTEVKKWVREADELIKKENDYPKAMAIYFRAARIGSEPAKKTLAMHLEKIQSATKKGQEQIAVKEFAQAAKTLTGIIKTYGPYMTLEAQVLLKKLPELPDDPEPDDSKPKSGSAKEYLAKAKSYYKKKDKKNTIKYLKKVVDEFPDSPEAKEASRVLKKLTK